MNLSKDRSNISINKSNKDIAIIGLECIFPDAPNKEAFWENLKKGINSIKEFPEARAKALKEYLSVTKKENVSFLKGAYVEDIDKFDASFFKLTPREAALMNPMQKLFLEVAWKAIEDAGYGGEKLKGSNTGVYIGFISDVEGYKYKEILREIYDVEEVSVATSGNLSSIIASRISYVLDLKGPAMLIDTACSSSLIAVHTACQAIRAGECNQAIAGGIRLSLLPIDDGIKVGMESTDGNTRAFDDSSDGTGVGEGVGAILLKPLYKAERDGDNIYAVVKGSAINQDGTTMGITAPNPLAQAEVILKAWQNSNIDPETIAYIEAHGTGTKLGDPIEIDAITKAFRRYTDKKQFCGIGSVKSNIGHLYEAAGIASLIKAVLCLENKEIPPSINFELPNRRIDFWNSPLYINDRLRPWETINNPRRCALSSFGFSGTNCHMVLEEYVSNRKGSENTAKKIFTLSAKKKELLEESIEQYKHFLRENRKLSIGDICYTASVGRGHYDYRLSIIISSLEELIDRIDSITELDGTLSHGIYYGSHKISKTLKEENSNKGLTDEELDYLNKKSKEIIDKGNYEEENLEHLCKLYIKGAEIRWDKLYKGNEFLKVSLPKYYFEKKKSWFSVS